MKNKKNLIGRVTIDFPIEVIPEELTAYMSLLTQECTILYVTYLFYKKKHHPEFKFTEFFDGSQLKMGYFFDDLGHKAVASELFIEFCRFIANSSTLESDIPFPSVCDGCMKESCFNCKYADLAWYQADAHEDPGYGW